MSDRYFAGLTGRVGPKIDALDPDAGAPVDEQIAEIAAEIKLE